MSATGFHPDPSAKAPWTRTIVLTAAYAGDDAATAAPASRARISRFMKMLQVRRALVLLLGISDAATRLVRRWTLRAVRRSDDAWFQHNRYAAIHIAFGLHAYSPDGISGRCANVV